jgi:hypothetical protein
MPTAFTARSGHNARAMRWRILWGACLRLLVTRGDNIAAVYFGLRSPLD